MVLVLMNTDCKLFSQQQSKRNFDIIILNVKEINVTKPKFKVNTCKIFFLHCNKIIFLLVFYVQKIPTNIIPLSRSLLPKDLP